MKYCLGRLSFLLICSIIYLTSANSSTDFLSESPTARRTRFESSLDKIKQEVYSTKIEEIRDKFNVNKVRVFISYAWEDDIKAFVDQTLSKDISRLGFEVLYDQVGIRPGDAIGGFEQKVKDSTYVIMLCTPQYLKRYQDHTPKNPTGVGREVEMISARLSSGQSHGAVIPIWRKGGFNECVPPLEVLRTYAGFSVTTDDHYYETMFKIAQTLFLYQDLRDRPIFGIQERFFGREVSITDLAVPQVALGHEKEYQRFLGGTLIYRPKAGSDEGKIEFRVADLSNPLDGEFDLSGCGDASKHLKIATGYKKTKVVNNAANKAEIFIVPKFLIQHAFAHGQAQHFIEMLSDWKNEWPFAIFWTREKWDMEDYDYQRRTAAEVHDGKISLYKAYYFNDCEHISSSKALQKYHRSLLGAFANGAVQKWSEHHSAPYHKQFYFRFAK